MYAAHSRIISFSASTVSPESSSLLALFASAGFSPSEQSASCNLLISLEVLLSSVAFMLYTTYPRERNKGLLYNYDSMDVLNNKRAFLCAALKVPHHIIVPSMSKGLIPLALSELLSVFLGSGVCSPPGHDFMIPNGSAPPPMTCAIVDNDSSLIAADLDLRGRGLMLSSFMLWMC